MSIKKKKIKSQPEDSLINTSNTSAVSSAPNGSPQGREELKEAGEERTPLEVSPAESGMAAASGGLLLTGRTDVEKRDLRDLAEDIIIAHDTRVKIVGEIIDDTQRMMANFKTKREQMAGELQKLLAKGESLRKKDFERMMVDVIDTHAKREEEVKEMLESFRRAEEEVQGKLRNLLKKGEKIRIKDFKKMMIEIKQEQERRTKKTSASITNQLQEMRGEVHVMLDNFKTERQSVATAWHEMLSLFHKGKSPANPEAEQVRYEAGLGNSGGNVEKNIKYDDNHS